MFNDESARHFLNSLQMVESCGWCRNTQHSVYRAGLCRHCYEIKLQISKLTRQKAKTKLSLEALRKRDPRAFDFVGYELSVAEKMGELAQLEGQSLGKVPSDVSGLDLEHALSAVSRLVIGKNVFDGLASQLGHSFSPDQLRLVAYLLRQVAREDGRRTRRKWARVLVTLDKGTAVRKVG